MGLGIDVVYARIQNIAIATQHVKPYTYWGEGRGGGEVPK